MQNQKEFNENMKTTAAKILVIVEVQEINVSEIRWPNIIDYPTIYL